MCAGAIQESHRSLQCMQEQQLHCCNLGCREAHQVLTVLPRAAPCSSNGPASSPLRLVRRSVRFSRLPDALSVREGWALMFCLSCSRKDCWMLRNLKVRMNWPGQRLAAYVSRARWFTYQKQIASSSSVHQGNNFKLHWNCPKLQMNSEKHHENSLIRAC